jgi:CBS domain-containing protein
MEKDEEIVKVMDLMTRNIVYISKDTNTMEAAKIMATKDISSILVKSEKDFIGIITDRDIIRKVVAFGSNSKEILAYQIMSNPLVTINENASVEEAAQKMRDNKIRRLVIKSKKGILGIITESDIVRVEPDLHFLIREHSRIKLHPYYSSKIEERLLVGFCEECENYSENLENVNGRWLCDECRN